MHVYTSFFLLLRLLGDGDGGADNDDEKDIKIN